jgi:nucleoside-diphosphate-sugar epimerase
MKRILITGATGQIGAALRSGLRGSYPLIRLVDIAPLGKTEVGEEIVAADIPPVQTTQSAFTAASVSSTIQCCPGRTRATAYRKSSARR